MNFKELCETRYAVKQFDGSTLSQDKIDQLLELIRLAPSSFGLQPFQVYVISNQELKEKLQPASFNQVQVSTCSHLLVFCANTKVMEQIDKYEAMAKEMGWPQDSLNMYIGMMRGFMENVSKDGQLVWAQKQTYIALAHAMLGAKHLGFDSCPMEGFQPQEYTKILELPEHLVPTLVCPVGIAADEPKPKLRFSNEELFVSLN